MDDGALIARTQAECSEQFETLYQRYHQRAYATASRIVGRFEAEDVAQDALLRIYSCGDRQKSKSNTEGLLRRIVINLSLNVLRRRGLLTFESLEDGCDSAALRGSGFGCVSQLSTEELLISRGDRDELEALIDELPPVQRIAVILRYVHGLETAEVATVQRCGLSAVKMRLTRGRDYLRRRLTEQPTNPAPHGNVAM